MYCQMHEGGGKGGRVHKSGRRVDSWSPAMALEKKSKNVVEEDGGSAVGWIPPEITQCLINPMTFKNLQVSTLLLSMTIMSVVSAFP